MTPSAGRSRSWRQIIEAADGDERLGVCLDTQHLWASGIAFATIEDADDLMKLVDPDVGMERLRCLHLNDSKVPFGANRDRHENIGKGTIGAKGLSALMGHPDLQGLPAILEVPGDGDGPRAEGRGQGPEDLEAGPGPPLLNSPRLTCLLLTAH